jgi:starvation-inducible DNA-binding protein
MTTTTIETGPHEPERENAEHGFLASESLTDDLQSVLVDLIELHIQGKQAHGNLVGKNFPDLHRQLDEIIEAGRECRDAVAERMRALHASVDGRTATVAKQTSLEQLSSMVSAESRVPATRTK